MFGKKTVLLVVSILVIAMLLASCAPTPVATTEAPPTATPAPEPIKIGVEAPLTGDGAVYGEQTEMGVECAVEEINAAGGIEGRPVVVEYCDSKGDPKEAAMCAQKFAADPDIFAIVGDVFSSCCLAGHPIYDGAGITQLSGSCTAPKLTQIGYTRFLRNVPLSDVEGMSMAALAINNFGASRIAIIHAADDYGIAVRDGAVAGVEKLGGEVVAMETYVQLVDKDFTAQLTKIIAADPDALLICGVYTEGGLIMRQAKIAGLPDDVVTVGSGGLNHRDFITLAGGAAEDSYVVLLYDFLNPDPRAVQFREMIMEKYGKEANEQTAYFYDLVYCIKEAVEKGATKENLHEVLRTIEVEGVTGMNKFNEVGDVEGKSFFINKIENDDWAQPGFDLDTTGLW